MKLPHLESTSLLVVDIQERLLPAMDEVDQPLLIKAVTNLALAMAEFGGHRAYTEQYPRGLGPTIAALAEPLAHAARLEKVEFSALANAGSASLGLRPDVILTGIEAHVCVLMTGLDLLAAGHRVWVPIDATSSRRRENRDNGLALLAKSGATLVNSESLIFASLGQAGGERFKRFSALIR
jgi:nicotinamidase-related amidase